MKKNIILLSFIICLSLGASNYGDYYNKIHTFKLDGNTTFSYFYTSLYVGTPPQRQTVIVDTGSYLLGFPCSDCKKNDCGMHIDKPFEPKLSLSSEHVMCNDSIDHFKCDSCDYKTKQCTWSISYSEGSSLYGHVMQDYIVVGDVVHDYIKDGYAKLDQNFISFINKERIKAPFGCTTRETNLFLTQDADGILGLSPSTNSQRRMPNIIDILFSKHQQNDEELVFSLCLSNVDGGYMSVGGYNRDQHIKGAKTNIISYQDGGMYTINLHKILVSGEDIGFNKNHFYDVIVDSGTTIMLGPRNVIDAMHKQFFSFCDKNKKNCDGNLEQKGDSICFRRDSKKYPNIQNFFNTFPPIQFQLDNDYLFEWEPQNYFFIDPIRDHNDDLHCFAFESGSSRVLLGGSWMRQYDILFDRQRNKMHFTKSDCSKESIDNSYITEHQATEEDIKLYNDILAHIEKNPEIKKLDKKEENSKDKRNQFITDITDNQTDTEDKNQKNTTDTAIKEPSQNAKVFIICFMIVVGSGILSFFLYIAVKGLLILKRKRYQTLHKFTETNTSLNKSVHPAAIHDQSSINYQQPRIVELDEDLEKEEDQAYQNENIHNDSDQDEQDIEKDHHSGDNYDENDDDIKQNS